MDAALHVSLLAGPADASEEPEATRVPFAFTGVESYAQGTDAVRMSGDAAVLTAAGVGARFAAAATDLTTAVSRLATSDDRRNPLYGSRVVGDTFREGRNLQEQALYGSPLDDAEPNGSGVTRTDEGRVGVDGHLRCVFGDPATVRHPLGVVWYATRGRSPNVCGGSPELGVRVAHGARDSLAEVWLTGRPVRAGRKARPRRRLVACQLLRRRRR